MEHRPTGIAQVAPAIGPVVLVDRKQNLDVVVSHRRSTTEFIVVVRSELLGKPSRVEDRSLRFLMSGAGGRRVARCRDACSDGVSA